MGIKRTPLKEQGLFSYETKSGVKYGARWRDEAGTEREKLGFRRIIDARGHRNKQLTLVAEGHGTVAPSAAKVTVREVGERWLKRRVIGKESWGVREEGIWRVHVEPYWGAKNLRQVTVPAIKDWIAELDRAPSTIADIHGVLCEVLDTAVEEKRIPSNPARGIPLPRRIPVDHVYLTEDQVHELADEVSQYSEVIHLLAHSGLRWGEMAALRPRDIRVDDLRIRIDRASSKVNATSKIVEPKTWERRTVAVPEEVMELLLPVIDAQPNRDGLLWSRPSDGRPLMPPTATGWYWKAVGRLRGPDPDEDMDEAEAALYESTRFPRVTAHQLRHTAASLMIADGAHIKTIQRQLGHKSATVTLDDYGHLYPDDLDDIAVRMGARFRAAAERRAGKTRGQAPNGDVPGNENGP